MTRRRASALETVFVEVPEHALEAYEAAFSSACDTVGFFQNEAAGTWRVEGVRLVESDDGPLIGALALAAAVSGVSVEPGREPTEAEGWLARTYDSFPAQLIGKRFCVRGSHLDGPERSGRITLTLDAGLAFGSGEHGSTRGCLLALERIAYRKPTRILDLGTGSGILAMAAARQLRRPVLATDIDPWSVRVTRQNVSTNRLGRLVRARLADGWRSRTVRQDAPYDLVFANILARPLCRMARNLSVRLRPGGTVILSGLLRGQARMVIAAHRRCGLTLEAVIADGAWATLIMRSA